ncbi:inner membrane protein YiaB, partial [Escherichia coli]
MKTSKTVAKLLFVVGALVYLVGLWISCPLLSGKGYFLGVLMTATFGNYAYLRAEKLGQLDNFFTHICQLVALITIGLLFIGVLNAPINAYEMVGNDSNLLIVFYVQIMPDDFVMQLHR